MRRHWTASTLFEVLAPDYQLEVLVAELKQTGNPYYIWWAIEVCIRYKKEFPEWVIAYLSKCAGRMKSDKAKKANNVYRVLPWIFDFTKKRGPGNLLEPKSKGSPDQLFPLKFVTWLKKGEDPIEAMHKACNEFPPGGKIAKADDKTLRRWLREDLGLKEWPKTTAEWKTITSSVRLGQAQRR